MKLLQLNTTVNSGSTGRIAEDIGRVLIENGHESYIAYGRGTRPSKSNLIKIGNNLDLYWHGFLTATFDRHGFGSRRATRNLISQIKELNPDIIGLHNLHGYYLNIRILFSSLAILDKPIVWTHHDCWAFTGHCTFYDSIDCKKWVTHCFQCPKTNKYPRSYLMDNSKLNYRHKKELFNLPNQVHIVTPSQWLAKELSISFLQDFPISVIYNGIDLDAFNTDIDQELISQYNLENYKVVLGVASVWDERKGLTEFIALSRQLSNDYKIVLVGLTPQQIDKLPENIQGIPRTESLAELRSLYASADVFCNPTFQDNFPTVNIEALACGTPIVTYNTGGSPEAIDASTGIVVNKGNIRALKEAIEKICSKGKLNNSKLCRKRAQDYFDKKDRYNDYLNLYKQLIINS